MAHNLNTMVIGVGGTGKKVVEQLVKIMDEELDEYDYPFLEFCVADSQYIWNGTSTASGEVKTIILPLTSVGALIPQAVRTNPDYQESSCWLPQYYNNPNAYTNAEIGQRRPPGLTYLIHSWNNIHNILFSQSGFFTHNPGAKNGVMRNNDHQLLVVGSLCGGTGGGTMIELIRIMHDELHRRGYNHKIKLFALAPSFFDHLTGVNIGHIYANYYSAICELNYFLHKDVFGPQKDYIYRLTSNEGGKIIRNLLLDEGRVPLIQELYLFENRPVGGRPGIQLDDMVRELARFFIINASNNQATHHNWNAVTGARAVNLSILTPSDGGLAVNNPLPKNQPCLYSSFGLANCRYPYKKLEKAISKKALEELVNSLLNYRQGSINNPPKIAAKNNAFQDSGLSILQNNQNVIGCIMETENSIDSFGLFEKFENEYNVNFGKLKSIYMPKIIADTENKIWNKIENQFILPLQNQITQNNINSSDDVINCINIIRTNIHQAMMAEIKNNLPDCDNLLNEIWKNFYSVQNSQLLPNCLLNLGNLNDYKEFFESFYSNNGPSGAIYDILNGFNEYLNTWDNFYRNIPTTFDSHPIKDIITNSWSWLFRRKSKIKCNQLIGTWYRLRLRGYIVKEFIPVLNNLITKIINNTNSLSNLVNIFDNILKSVKGTINFKVINSDYEYELPFNNDFQSIIQNGSFIKLVEGLRDKILLEPVNNVQDYILINLKPFIYGRDDNNFSLNIAGNIVHQSKIIMDLLNRRYIKAVDTINNFERWIKDTVDFEEKIGTNNDAKAHIQTWKLNLTPRFEIAATKMRNANLFQGNSHNFMFVNLPLDTVGEPCGTNQTCPIINSNMLCNHFDNNNGWCLKRFLIENCTVPFDIQQSEQSDMQLMFLSCWYGFFLDAAESLQRGTMIPKINKSIEDNYRDYINHVGVSHPPHRYYPMARVDMNNPDRFPKPHEDFFILPLDDFEAKKLDDLHERLESADANIRSNAETEFKKLGIELFSGRINNIDDFYKK